MYAKSMGVPITYPAQFAPAITPARLGKQRCALSVGPFDPFGS